MTLNYEEWLQELKHVALSRGYKWKANYAEVIFYHYYTDNCSPIETFEEHVEWEEFFCQFMKINPNSTVKNKRVVLDPIMPPTHFSVEAIREAVRVVVESKKEMT
jgi:hypothetical protein